MKTLYRWGENPDYKWMGFGDKETHPVYKGQVEDGEFHGQGTLTYTDGRKYVGKFKDDEKWNGTGYDKNGNILVKFVNGKMIKQ